MLACVVVNCAHANHSNFCFALTPFFITFSFCVTKHFNGSSSVNCITHIRIAILASAYRLQGAIIYLYSFNPFGYSTVDSHDCVGYDRQKWGEVMAGWDRMYFLEHFLFVTSL